MRFDLSTTGFNNPTPMSKVIVTGPCEVTALGMLSGGTAGTVIFYDGNDNTGPMRWALGAGVNMSDCVSFSSPLRFKVGVYAEITNSARAFVAITNPSVNQT